MLAIFYALLTMIAWGTWLTPAQTVPFKNPQVRTFYVAAANLLIAFFVAAIQRFEGLNAAAFWLPFVGGLIWAVSGLCAFTATANIGTARAFGIWAPLNIIVSMLWGALAFDEFITLNAANRLLLGTALVVLIAGVVMIILAKGGSEQARGSKAVITGFLGAVGAGILWGSYFIPIKISEVSMWVAAFPMAVGIFIGSLILLLLTRQPVRLGKVSYLARASLSGVLWAAGNYGVLLLMGIIGTGKGFTISQLSVVINAFIGIYFLKDPHPKSRAATLTLIGCVLATVGGIVLGNLK